MARPFLKWAGGKGQLLNVINDNLPAHFDRYIEPFVGSGAVLFSILENRNVEGGVFINDINTDLVHTYESIRDHCEQMIDILSELQDQYLALDNMDDRAHMYYQIREAYNQRQADMIMHSCYFIFLNKTCFNGLYRVNARNLFNVPFAKPRNPRICDQENLRAVSQVLAQVIIRNQDYGQLLDEVREGSFVYLDPPYRPLNQTSAFTSYSAAGFGDEEQRELKLFCDAIHARGAYFMLSNSDPKNEAPDDEFFDELYADYQITRVPAKRFINSKASGRGEINELLITNYQNDAVLLF